MRGSWAGILLAGIMLPTSGMSAEMTETEKAIAGAVFSNVADTSRDYWIATINAFGDKERIGIIFGMTDNLAFCDEVTSTYRARYPNNRFFCEPAN
ncbi:MAG: hypothetical protein EOR36_32915 [Mesorhizobium sp.]|uniref:hypothetical protein n=2 Tax=Mesorhizobium TaxID=68287 RepID=UPI000FCA60CC|nr:MULTISPECIES: hypothetical protein [unclassified Mesorhizobium]RUV66739.1 hypothetical protein EOA78_32980 [Mesorhizobium sp. M5C.F.Cr.IN.023.01.1.1]RWF88400.1 MAG: hypothetical protein EOQ45_32310 [Mesorhizobium sp.]RWI46029.1 MAG: hypothetical protein EOR16_35945 [Mesorhizobium sp.]RWJ01482.1 MAG: hypothetical protein EOR24_35685 [Mesorhizobium sp.]RWJ09334.1 MAG: hypothetical protein EOR25_34660 [Mesorhizobium sp.]